MHDLWPIAEANHPAGVEAIGEAPEAKPIDEKSLADYVRASGRVAQLNEAIARSIDVEIRSSDTRAIHLAELATAFGIADIAGLDDLLKTHARLIVPMAYYVKTEHHISRGHCLQILFEILGAKLATPEAYHAIVQPLKYNNLTLDWAKEARRAYHQILKSDQEKSLGFR